MPLNIFPGKNVIGVDIGSSSVKLLELKGSGPRITPASYAGETVSIDVETKSPDEKRQHYITALKNALKKAKFKSKNAAISVSGSSVLVRFVRFPKMSYEELKKTLQFEAEPHIPFDIADVDMTAQIIGDIEQEGELKMQTMLVAVKKDLLKFQLEILEGAGLFPSVVDIDAFAASNAYSALTPEASSKTIMLLNIGASVTNINIIDKGISKVVRDISIAGNAFTRAVGANIQTDLAEAEEMKKKYGLSGEGSPDTPGKVYQSLTSSIRNLISEVDRSIDFFAAQSASSRSCLDYVILSGGSAAIKGLSDLISKEIRLPVKIFNPFIGTDSAAVNGLSLPSLSVVTGLALRKIGDVK